MMDLFEKKFKTRVRYYAKDKYTVDYCSYYLFPKWRSLRFWFEQTLTEDTECWCIRLFHLDDAEELQKSLKSIEDVREYFKPHEVAEKSFYARKSVLVQKQKNAIYQ